MKIEFDKNKSSKNIADNSRGFGFEIAVKFNWQTCVTILDCRNDYTEERFISTGFIEERLHVLVWTKRKEKVRIISLRKANKREVKFYEENK